MRQIILDTETTGLNKLNNRIIDIGMIEIVDYIETGNVYQSYINPMMPISLGSQRICGITDDMVKDSPEFKDIVDEIIEFIGDSPIVAHNASFDMGFINMEMKKAGKDPLKNEVIDTLKIARSLYKNNNSLDALCKRFGVDLSDRVQYGHGALLDCYLLSKVYYMLIHENTQNIMDLVIDEQDESDCDYKFPIRKTNISQDDYQKHLNFCEKWSIIA